jgi:hypothetical protein
MIKSSETASDASKCKVWWGRRMIGRLLGERSASSQSNPFVPGHHIAQFNAAEILIDVVPTDIGGVRVNGWVEVLAIRMVGNIAIGSLGCFAGVAEVPQSVLVDIGIPG